MSGVCSIFRRFWGYFRELSLSSVASTVRSITLVVF